MDKIDMFKVHIPFNVIEELQKVLCSGYIGQGPKVEEFEDLFGKYISNPFVATMNSCTSAITLALRLSDVKPGDEVITTPMTCTATNIPILSFGANPVWAGINSSTGNIDPKDVEKRITKKTKAIIGVDWGGLPIEAHTLRLIANKYGIKLIEDAAHAIGAVYEDKKHLTGCGLADFTCFSFQAIKHITTGDGGILTCKSEEDYKKAKILRWYGIDREAPVSDTRIGVDIEEYGYKFHMNDINATIGISQLKHLDTILEKHRNNAEFYNNNLSDYFNKESMTKFWSMNSFWLYTILVKHRDEFKNFMLENNIPASQVHKRNDEYSVFKPYNTSDKIPGLDYFSDHMICLPVNWSLSKEKLEYIVEKCNEFAERKS